MLCLSSKADIPDPQDEYTEEELASTPPSLADVRRGMIYLVLCL
jgi:hypothetical protein